MSNDVLSRVRALLPGIRARAEEADRQRRVPAESIAELADAGVFRLLQPKRYGGLEHNPAELYESVRAIAGACPSTGWVASVLGVHPWQISLFEERAQDDVWKAAPDALVSSSYAPTGELVEVEGGYRLSGRWSFSSGSDHCQWVLLGTLCFHGAGGPPEYLTALVPRSDYTVEDVWDVIGLSGTGSNDIVIDDAFVPAYRAYSSLEQDRLVGPGQAVNTSPIYTLPFGMVFSYAITNAIVGAAQGAYTAHVERMKERVRLSYGGQKVAEDPFAHVRVARAAGEIEAAELTLDHNVAEQMRYVEAGEKIPERIRLRARRDQVLGTERALRAIEILFENSGGHSIKRGNPIERHWRDAHAGTVHVINDVERALAMYGRGEFGVPIDAGMY
ncbi:3-hydroxy-9,10-secoandrosta-1,3,5(10)-triene-9,17-dione monooxygenase oxygenase subunit [Nocardia cerradoensis]|uniref:Flavin-dependent monooxygenase, oxygenase subunit HsaA n=1 Tax=Nocardia cerradoensis TaxID=85688 RepID=A0A231GTJ7_9NOCA|nr:3-hydroxy-9,10-secoandrosta-1,3,5(10)-triene-9,17-dione monooxygenase oxygenase subunit [Nocardia cerradoensis]NKY43672.1 flavin-dependent monooxygenase [Nocardia cerradoensis]OXR39875.1 Flavin-dependent monooxygenase, oxygenase subunit HsaA [Nocardia cerradoensis]